MERQLDPWSGARHVVTPSGSRLWMTHGQMRRIAELPGGQATWPEALALYWVGLSHRWPSKFSSQSFWFMPARFCRMCACLARSSLRCPARTASRSRLRPLSDARPGPGGVQRRGLGHLDAELLLRGERLLPGAVLARLFRGLADEPEHEGSARDQQRRQDEDDAPGHPARALVAMPGRSGRHAPRARCR